MPARQSVSHDHLYVWGESQTKRCCIYSLLHLSEARAAVRYICLLLCWSWDPTCNKTWPIYLYVPRLQSYIVTHCQNHAVCNNVPVRYKSRVCVFVSSVASFSAVVWSLQYKPFSLFFLFQVNENMKINAVCTFHLVAHTQTHMFSQNMGNSRWWFKNEIEEK